MNGFFECQLNIYESNGYRNSGRIILRFKLCFQGSSFPLESFFYKVVKNRFNVFEKFDFKISGSNPKKYNFF